MSFGKLDRDARTTGILETPAELLVEMERHPNLLDVLPFDHLEPVAFRATSY